MLVNKTRTLFLWILGGLFLFAATAFILTVNYEMREQALKEAESKTRMLLDRNLATHTYFSHQLKPRLFEWSEHFRDPQYFDPSWMSSTYAIREMQDYFQKLNPNSYYYKECAINARHPENEADAYEKAFIQRLNARPDLTMDSGIRTIDGQPYFITLRRGETMEQSCLRCHSTPENAPDELVSAYGPERSFHREVGEVVSAVSIRIPLQAAFAHANRLSWTLSGVLLSILAVLFATVLWFSRHRIFEPIDRIRKQSRLIAQSDIHLGKTVPLPRGLELRELTESFNTMSLKLRRHMDGLEAKVKERTAAYQASEARYRAMMEGMPDPAYVCAPDYTIAYMNAAMARRIGRDAIGESCYKAVSQQKEPCRDCPYPEVRKGNSVHREITSTFDGRFYNVSHAPIVNADGNVSKLSIYRDVTEFKEMEAELFKSRKFEAVAIMASGVVHDFNNLMMIILGYISLAAGEKIPENVRKMLKNSENACLQAKKLTKKLLIFSKADEPDKQPGEIDKIARDAVDAGLAETPSIHYTINGDADLKKPAFDEDQMEYAFSEIVRNAKEAMAEGGALHVSLTNRSFPDDEDPGTVFHAPGPYVRIRFDDRGVGIKPADLQRVFDPYFTTKPMGAVKGTGLGLTTVYSIVKKHGGYIQIDSQPGSGTSVIIDLPVFPDSTGRKESRSFSDQVESVRW